MKILHGRIKTAEEEMNQKLDARLNTSMANVTDESRQMVKKMVAEAGESVRDDAISIPKPKQRETRGV